MILLTESEEVIRLLRKSHVLTVRIKRKNTEKLQEKWHMEDYVISSSYAIIYFKDIY